MRRLYAQCPGRYTIAELCGLFGKSKQAYYKYNEDVELRRIALEDFAIQYMREVRAKDPGIGGLKIWIMYRREFGAAASIGRDRFCDIFDRLGLKVKRRRRGVRTTDSNHDNPLYPNLVKALIPLRFGEVMVGDITYIPLTDSVTGERTFCYASLLLDSYSKVLLGYSVGETLSSVYPIEALEMGLEVLMSFNVDLSLSIHHSDRGTQYTSVEYVRILKQHHVKISMTESGNPKDNPEAERINGTLKNELFKGMVFNDIEQVREAMHKAVLFYNHERPHCSIEMHTPMEAVACTGRFKRAWVSYRENAIDRNAKIQPRETPP